MTIEAYKSGYVDGAANELRYKQRCEQLEQLCRDMYARMSRFKGSMSAADADAFDEVWTDRMDALGLLDED